MKNIKRIICFLLMIVSVSFFSACSKSDNSVPETGGSEIEENGGSGGGSTESGGEDDGDEEQDDYVPYTSNEIMIIGANLLSKFFNEYEADLSNDDLFDDNVYNMKPLFLNGAKMITAISEMENLPYGYCVKGSVEELDDYTKSPNKVERFDASFKSEDVNGYSSVKFKIILMIGILNLVIIVK